jgi:hypothetical protein
VLLADIGDHESAVTAEIEADILRMAQAVGPDLILSP